jgi:hypothetical protein
MVNESSLAKEKHAESVSSKKNFSVILEALLFIYAREVGIDPIHVFCHNGF